MTHPDQLGVSSTTPPANAPRVPAASRGRPSDPSLIALAAAVSGGGALSPVSRRAWHWKLLGPAAVVCAAVLGFLLAALAPSPPPRRAPVLQPAGDWEPLATYAYESHLPSPPASFPTQ